MVQKLVLLATAPKTNERINAPHTTVEAITAGLASFTNTSIEISLHPFADRAARPAPNQP
jgi:hypothetical protein